MSYFPRLNENAATQWVTDTFGGYNHNLKIGDGEFFEMENMTSDYFPLLANRGKRGIVTELNSPGGLLGKTELAYVDDCKLFYKGEDLSGYLAAAGCSISEGEKNLVSMGAYILIFPDKLYINSESPEDCGSINAEYKSSGEISYSMCKIDGSAYTEPSRGENAPESPTNGALWIDTASTPHVLKQYSSITALWNEISSVYTKISCAGIGKDFKVYDGVSIYGCAVPGNCADQIDALNGSKIVYDRGDDYIVVVGLLDEACKQSDGSISVSRTMPEMDFITEAENRLWGCKYGNVNGRPVNEIYACALGDFKNWNQFLGASADSYEASVGTDGPWTGAVTHLGYPIFFKENCLHKVHISSVGAHRITDTACRGVQKGSHKSLQVVNEKLFYKSISDVCVYEGALPEGISDNLGAERYSDAVAGSIEDKYYISMKDRKGKWHMFVYDSAKGFWHREDETEVMAFARCGGELYFIDKTRKNLMCVGGTVGQLEGDQRWKVETGLQGYHTPGKKYISQINLRVHLGNSADLFVSIEYDSLMWRSVTNVNSSCRPDTIVIPVRPQRCDHFRIRLEGRGDVKIYSMTKIYRKGSDR